MMEEENAIGPAPGEQQLRELELRPAALDDVPALGALYAAAFASNPAYRFIFSGAPDRPAPPNALSWLFKRRAWLLLRQRCQLLVAVEHSPAGGGRSSRVVGAGAIVPFDRKPTLRHYLLAGILAWPLWWGLPSLLRGLSMDGGLVRLMSPGGPLHGQRVSAELVLMAVQPDCQGCGVGRRLLRALLSQWDTGSGGGLVLATQEAHAARLYQEQGFVLLDGTAVPAKGSYLNWFLFRPEAGAPPTTDKTMTVGSIC